MIQPFVRSIVDEGEYSLSFFGGVYSHAIRKFPKPPEFRVQEGYGGTLSCIEPELDLLRLARETLDCIEPKPLYARADFVRLPSGFALMELELIEPSLYFNMDQGAPLRFTRTFDQWMHSILGV